MTKRIILTEDPIQLSDGTNCVHLTVSTNKPLKFLYYVGKDKPDTKNTGFQTFIDTHAMNIATGWVVWAWNPDPSVEVILGISEKTL